MSLHVKMRLKITLNQTNELLKFCSNFDHSVFPGEGEMLFYRSAKFCAKKFLIAFFE